MKKEWKIFNATCCPNCGDDIEVLSECLTKDDTATKQWFIDGEEVRCVSKCGFKTSISADEAGVWLQYGNIDEL